VKVWVALQQSDRNYERSRFRRREKKTGVNRSIRSQRKEKPEERQAMAEMREAKELKLQLKKAHSKTYSSYVKVRCSEVV